AARRVASRTAVRTVVDRGPVGCVHQVTFLRSGRDADMRMWGRRTSRRPPARREPHRWCCLPLAEAKAIAVTTVVAVVTAVATVPTAERENAHGDPPSCESVCRTGRQAPEYARV